MPGHLAKTDDPDLQYAIDCVNRYLTLELDTPDEDLVTADFRPSWLSNIGLLCARVDLDDETEGEVYISVDLLCPSISYYLGDDLVHRREFFDLVDLGNYVANISWDALYNSAYDYIDV